MKRKFLEWYWGTLLFNITNNGYGLFLKLSDLLYNLATWFYDKCEHCQDKYMNYIDYDNDDIDQETAMEESWLDDMPF
jgi:hypothetical protein